MFGRGTKKLPSVTNTILVDARDKSLHEWQQDVGAFTTLVERLTVPGALVVDPYVGTGTTGVACVHTGRRFIGGDVDDGQVAVARARIAEALAARATRAA